MERTALWHAIHEPTAGPEYRHEVHRAVAPRATLDRITPLLPKAGITRLADVTGLDYIGIPTYQAIRPNSRNLSVSQGKGATRLQAKVSALMEALELFHAESVAQERCRVPLGEMRRALAYDPSRLLRPVWGTLTDALEITWVTATDLATGQATWVPLQLCEMQAIVSERMASIHFLPTSNGLASGNTFAEAVVHALCELVERDAVARDQARRFSHATCVPHETVDSTLARDLIERFVGAGARLHIHAPRSPTGLPCFEAFLDADDIPHVTFFGAGCATRRETAIIRALTEVAQSRLTHIVGSRDDLDHRHYPALGEFPKNVTKPRWPDGGATAFDDVAQLGELTLPEELAQLVALVRAQTGASPMAVDLSRPDLGIPVVHVIAPGLAVNHYERVA